MNWKLEKERERERMREESNYNSIFKSPCKNLRGLKGLNSIVNNNNSDASSYAEEIINDRELAQRRAEEAGTNYYAIYLSPLQLENYFYSLVSWE